MDYAAREQEADFLMNQVFNVQENWSRIEAYQEFSEELVRAIVAEGGRLAAEVMAPLYEVGDTQCCQLQDGEVTTPPGFKEAFAQLTEGGWLGLTGNPKFGGQGMPKSLAGLIEEMFWAANSSLFLYGSLTVGACLSIDAHGSAEQKNTYLEKLYSGQWTGAMALTESHAGTDLGMMRTKAEPQADGSYRITGTKIFITSGEHDMAENIVHLVLARIADGPKGTKGISLFIVPKFVPNDDGTLGPRNGWSSGSLEHKMGIKGSATSVINYDGAKGFLLGIEHQGLAGMFTMMNYERLSVGLQGLGAGDLATSIQLDMRKTAFRAGLSPARKTWTRKPTRCWFILTCDECCSASAPISKVAEHSRSSRACSWMKQSTTQTSALIDSGSCSPRS